MSMCCFSKRGKEGGIETDSKKKITSERERKGVRKINTKRDSQRNREREREGERERGGGGGE